MRWFKHLSSASENEAMAELIQEFGAEGYGVFWIIVEKIAHLMDKSDRCFARYSMNFWRTFTKSSPKKLQNILTFLEKSKIFSLKFEKNYLTIECPKLLFYRDEYTEKTPKKNAKVSGHSPDKCRDTIGTNIGRDSPPDTEAETETERDAETKEIFNHSANHHRHHSYPRVRAIDDDDDFKKNKKIDFGKRQAYVDYLIKIFPGGGVENFMTVKLSAGMNAWAEEGVTIEDLDTAVKSCAERSVTRPEYYIPVAIQFCRFRKEFGSYARGSPSSKKDEGLDERVAKLVAEKERAIEDYERECK